MKKILFVLATLLLAQTASAADLVARDARVRLMPPVAQSSAAYMTLKNTADSDINIIGVTTDAAASSDLHAMRMQDGKMVMFALDSVSIPAHGEFSFAPGGFHIMLMGLSRPLHEGDVVNIVLHLADGGAFTVQAPVRDMRMGKQMHGMH